jgi:hypothetical protein
MTPEYKTGRTAKHAAQKALLALVAAAGTPEGTIDLTPKTPRLAFLNGKMFKQGNGGRKNRSGYALEHEQANNDNLNVCKSKDGLWYYYDETEQQSEDKFVTRDQAEAAMNRYFAWLNQPKEIGGVSENLPISGDNRGPISN